MTIFLPDTAPLLVPPKIERPQFMKTAFEQRYDYESALLEADAQDVRLRYARNQAWPQLDAFATYGLNGLQGNYGDSFDQGASGHTAEWSAGLQFSIPLGFVKERAQLDLVKGLKEQAIIRIRQTELTVGVDVDTVISRIITNKQRVETAQKTRELSEEAVRIALKRLEEGQTSSFDVIEQQQKLYLAKSRELGALAELNKSITQLWLATGTMLERNGIVFDDPTKSKPKPPAAKPAVVNLSSQQFKARALRPTRALRINWRPVRCFRPVGGSCESHGQLSWSRQDVEVSDRTVADVKRLAPARDSAGKLRQLAQ